MGDYVKLIVHAELSPKIKKQELESQVEQLPRTESGYHCEGQTLLIEEQEDSDGELNFTLITQTKWGYGQEEFLDWLAPFVTQGSGEAEAWAIQFDEYSPRPTIRYMRDPEEGE